MYGIKVSLKEIYGTDSIKGRSFAVQGLGSVGNVLAEELINLGGEVYVSDMDEAKLYKFKDKAEVVPPERILYLNVDVLAPCGPSYVINSEIIPKLKCKITAGGANCILENELKDDQHLYQKGILIAPDYVINSGEVMQGIAEFNGERLEDARERLPIIADNLRIIYKLSKERKKGTYAIARELALSRITQ